MSMDSYMNGHLFSLDDYASPISTLYLSATHSATPITRVSNLPGGAYRPRRILLIDYDRIGIRKESYPGFPKKDGELFAFCCNFVPINIYNDKKHYENWSFLFG